MRKTGTIALATGVAFCSLASADDVALPGSGATTTPVTSDAAPAHTPNRGTTMSKVEAEFGAPTQRLAAVGNPPITRWEYPGFVVYFEHERVVHSVVR